VREGEKVDRVKNGFEMQFGILKTFMMEERPTPLLYECPDTLEKELGEAVMGDSDYVTVEPGQRCRLLFDAGTVTNAYMRYETEGGRDAELTFTYFEKFTKGIYEVKRDDYLHGEIGKNG